MSVRTDATPFASASKPIDAWVITDQGNLRQSVLAEFGVSYVHMHEKLHCRRQMRYMAGLLSVQCPRILWIRLGGPHSGSGNRHDNVRASNLMHLAQLQVQSGRTLVLEANSRSLVWSLQHVRDVVQHLHVSQFAWCRTENSTEGSAREQPPCNTVVQIATNLVGLGSVRCECPAGTAHVGCKLLSSEDFHRRAKQVLSNIFQRADLLGRKRTIATHIHSQSESLAVDAPCGAPAAVLNRKQVSFEVSEDDFKDMHASSSQRQAFRTTQVVNSTPADAELKSQAALTNGDFSFKTCLEILNAIHLRSHPTARAATALNDTGSSCYVFGLYKHGAEVGITGRTEKFPQTVKFLNHFGAYHGAVGEWTSMSINFNTQLDMHWDFGNLRGSDNHLIGLGNYREGQLWVELLPEELSSHKRVEWMTSDRGDMMGGCLLHCKHRMIRFEPERRHKTMPWTGNRITITYYANRGIMEAGKQMVNRLLWFGFPLSQSVHLNSPCAESASEDHCDYPTEQAIKRREVLKKGHQPKKKKQVVEQHRDDCGESLDSILPDVASHYWSPEMLGSLEEASESPEYFAKADDVYAQVCASMMYHGSGCMQPHHKCVENGVCSLEQLNFMFSTALSGAEVHLVELFGSPSSGLYLLSKGFHVQSQSNFNVVACVDISNPREFDRLNAYLSRAKPVVTIISPASNAFHAKACEVDRLAVVCLQVANGQASRGSYFVVEQSFMPGLFQTASWQKAGIHMRDLQRRVFDQDSFNRTGVSRQTEVWTNSRILANSFDVKGADESRVQRGSTIKSGGVTGSGNIPWSYMLCCRVAAAVADVALLFYFPVEPVDDRKSTRHMKCNGCRWHKRREDASHSRVGDCKYPNVESVEWKCPGCKNNKPRTHESHSLGPDCQWAVSRDMPSGASRERKGHAPRDTRVPASRDPTAQARLPGAAVDAGFEPSSSSRRDGAAGVSAKKRDAVAQVTEGGAGSSDDHLRRSDRIEAAVGDDVPLPSGNDSAPAPAGEVAADDDVRDGAAGDNLGPDWTRFDLGHALQELRSVRESIVRRALRKLHIRFYHPSSQRMRALLAAAGVDASVLDLVPQITDTCVICRSWNKPGPRSVASSRLPNVFNQEIQIDLLFVKDKIILHVVDVCTRFCAGCLVSSKDADELLTALHRVWIAVFGPPAAIISDQEQGIMSDAARAWMARRDIRFIQRARYQHAAMVERHNALLRRQILIMLDQTLEDGVRITFEAVLCESIYAKNALLRIGGSTPYEAVLGRTPPLYDVLSVEAGQDVEARNSEQVRSKAVAAMLQATAAEKANRASVSKTRTTGELLQLQVGDQVDFYRQPATKDLSGWLGPATVVDLTQLSEGQVHVRFQGKIMACRVQDVRRAMIFLSLLYVEPSTSPVDVIKQTAESFQSRVVRLGWFKQLGSWKPFEQNAYFSKEVVAGLHMAACNLQFNGVVSFRLGCGVHSLPAVACDESLLVWWEPGRLDSWCHAFVPGTQSLNFDRILGVPGRTYAFIQFFAEDTEKILEIRAQVHDVPNLGGVHEPTLPRLHDVTEQVRIRQAQRALENRRADESQAQRFDIYTPESSELESEHPVSQSATTNSTEHDSHDDVDDDIFAFATSHPPNVCVSHASESAFVFEEESLDEPPQLGVTPEFAKYLTMLNSCDAYASFNTAHCDRKQSVLAVIERVNNIITRAEALENVERCRKAMVLELMRWHKHGAWERGARAGAQNVLSSKWVLKWKDIKGSREVKARLVAQGFKDTQAVENYAGTTSRWGQRMIIIAAVQFKWRLVSADVSEAFLRGMTFKELFDEGHDKELRKVQLTLPPGAVELLRTLPGMEEFSEETEVLFLKKPGFGLKDAPRLWAKALRRVLTRIGLKALQTDSQLYVMHDAEGRLMISVHVDDLKLTGETKRISDAISILEKEFDALKLEEDNFTHLGLKHTLEPDGTRCVSQEHYIAELKPIPESDVKVLDAETPVSADVQKFFMSLLGGISWVTQTRPDVSVFVSALQRRLKQPRACDVLNLNRVLKYLKLKPLCMRYAKIAKPWRLVAVSDSSFKGEDQDHLAVRAGVIALVDREG